ncbi:hypothetical protein Tco_0882778 [Tanacetum coccineum]
MEAIKCSITKITPATIVPSGIRLQTISIPAVAPNAEIRMRYFIAKNSLIRAYQNCYGHPFIKPNFALGRNSESPRLVPNQATSTLAKPPSKNDLDLIFQPMFDEYFKPPSFVSTTISAATLPSPDIVGASSTTNDKDAPSLSTSPTTETTKTPIQSTNIKEPNNEEEVAEFDNDTFTNQFGPPVTSLAESSSRIIDTSNMHTFQKPQTHIRRWTKDHPLVTIIDTPSEPVST